MSRIVSNEPKYALRKVRSVVTGDYWIYRVESRFQSYIQIRKYGDNVARQTKDGWKVFEGTGPDRRLVNADRGLSAMYDSMVSFKAVD